MTKKDIKKQLVKEDKVPGISVTQKAQKDSAKDSKNYYKEVSSKMGEYDKASKSEVKDAITPVKQNYENNEEEDFHNQMEIMNGQEMITYDRTNTKFNERAIEAIEGSSNMGNNPDWANVVPEQPGFKGPKFGKELVKNIKSSEKKRKDNTSSHKFFGDFPYESRPYEKNYAVENQNKRRLLESDLGHGYTHFAIFKSDNKIVDGWDYSELFDEDSKSYDNTSVKEYSKIDLMDNYPDNKVSEFKIVTKKYLDKVGIDPSDTNNWYRHTNNMTNDIKMNEATKMKRLRFKKPFNGVHNALKLIPEGYKVDNKTFEMTDGDETYKIRWEGGLNEGQAIILQAESATLVAEDVQKMKHLMGYESNKTLGNLKGSERINENESFNDIWNKTKSLIKENDEDYELEDRKGEYDINPEIEPSNDIQNEWSGEGETKSSSEVRQGLKSSDMLDKLNDMNPEERKTFEEFVNTFAKYLSTPGKQDTGKFNMYSEKLINYMNDVISQDTGETEMTNEEETCNECEEKDRFDEIFEGYE